MWVREPSIQVCAVECGAKCCREPGYLPVSLKEVAGSKKLFPAKTMFRNEVTNEQGTFRTEDTGHWYLMFADSGGQCPNLAEDNSCSIWIDRPQACRDFPAKPHVGCLVYPGESQGVDDTGSVASTAPQ